MIARTQRGRESPEEPHNDGRDVEVLFCCARPGRCCSQRCRALAPLVQKGSVMYVVMFGADEELRSVLRSWYSADDGGSYSADRRTVFT